MAQIGVLPQYCAQQETILTLKEKLSFSGDDFSVTDQHGHEVVVCKGKRVSLSDRKEFTDAKGAPLFTLRNKHFRLHKTLEATVPSSGATLFKVASKLTLLGRSKMTCTFTNAFDQRPMELVSRGDWFDRKAEITLDGRVVAEIGRQFFNARELILGKQSYQVRVVPGVGLALMAGICICLDEMENEEGGK